MAATATHTDDHAHPPATVPEAMVDVAPIRRYSLIAAVLGLGVFAVGGAMNVGADEHHGVRDFFLAYLCGFVFWMCVPFGALGLSMIGFLASASWNILFRRIFQAAVRTLPVLFVLGLPVIAGLFLMGGDQSPYWWSAAKWHELTDAQKAALDRGEVKKFTDQGWEANIAELAVHDHTKPEAVEENLHKIHDWLSPGFFTLRYVVYFAVLGALAFLVLKHSRTLEDQDDAASLSRLRYISGPGVVVFVLTLTLMVTDWVMSVEETWASSMFPVIFGMNMFLTTITFSTLVFYTLVRVPNDTAPAGNRPDLTAVIKDKFRIDVGSLTLGFCMVWSYGSFCQFMVIWAGNLPEEITYYLKRGGGEADHAYKYGWIWLSYFLMAFHWLVPFIVLLFREVKTSPRAMKVVTIGLLTVCAADVCWWIVPSVPHEHTWMHLPMALGAILGLGGVWGLVFCRELTKRAILPTNREGRFLAAWGHH